MQRLVRSSRQWTHSRHWGEKRVTTWSPTARSRTPSPTASTTPPPSWPSTVGEYPDGSTPEAVYRSVWQTPHATSRTSTSPARGSARSTSWIASGCPNSSSTAARIFIRWLLLSADGHGLPHEPTAAEAYAHRVVARRRPAHGVQVERGGVAPDPAAAVRVDHAAAREPRSRRAARHEADGACHPHAALLLLAGLARDAGVAAGGPVRAGRALRARVPLRPVAPSGARRALV